MNNVKEIFNIIGIDPGNNMGISIFTIEAETLKILNIHTEFYVLDHYVSMYTTDKVQTKLEYISLIMKSLINRYKPVAIGIETAFMNSRFPKAVMYLSQYVSMIEYTCINYNSFIHLFKYMPKYIKAKISTGNATKDDISVGINNIPEIVKYLPKIIFTEHEVDAIAITYVMLTEIRTYPLILCSI